MGLHEWNGCTCVLCGQRRNEHHDTSKDCMRCSICGKIVVTNRHDWSKDCEICSKCGKTRDNAHEWDGCKCIKCGKTRDERHDWSENCEICCKCGATRENAHEWDGCKCIKCGAVRDKEHEWDECKCIKCGRVRSGYHNWNKDECIKCGCIRIKTVLVQGGEFERKNVKVSVDDFYIGMYPVTQEEYKKVTGSNPSQFKGDLNPVEHVTWYDAVEFCNLLSEMEGFEKCYSGNEDNITCDFAKNGYRLPTEAEWEYSARGGKNSRGFKYSGSNDVNEVGIFFDNSGHSSKPVGSKKPNEIGIYDMSGNVFEWCWDWFVDDNYKGQRTNNPEGPDTGIKRVTRGGCWGRNEEYEGNDFRYSLKPGDKGSANGFRIVRKRNAAIDEDPSITDEDQIMDMNPFSLK